MPNGVICGGALEGSNHAGEIVTCHAMTALPAGSFPKDAGAARATSAKLSAPTNAGQRRRIWNEIIGVLPCGAHAAKLPGLGSMPGFRIVSHMLASGNMHRPRGSAP